MAQRSLSRRSRSEEPDDDYNDEPRGRGRRDEDSDAEPPRRGRSSRDEEPEDDEPRRGRRSSSRDEPEDDEPRRGRRSRDDDDDDHPRGREERRERPKSSTVGKGWGGYDKVKSSGGGDYVNPWKLPTKATLIKFLDGEPFTTFSEHWLDDRKGKKSFICLGEDCPLCDLLGDRPRGFALFNILDLTNPDKPKVEFLKAGTRVANLIKGYDEDKKTSPVNRDDLYWSIHKSGDKGGNVQTNLIPVKERDVEEDWDCAPFTEDELIEFEADMHTEESVVFISSKADLKKVANEYD